MDFLDKAKSVAGKQFGEFTEGFSFPATKDDIVAQARRKHLPPDVMNQIEKLPNKKYESVSDLVTTAARNLT